MKIYFISGLAADSRVFEHIRLPVNYQPVYLDWIRAKKDESLQSYALRLSEKIDLNEKFILVGLSMGGMVAAEIAKRYKPVATILISSVATYKQFPKRFRLAYYLKLHKLIPAKFFKSTSLIKRIFTVESKKDKIILTQVIKDSDPEFIRWALGAILEWKNEEIPEKLWHIHGSKDEIFPVRHIKPTHIIPKGRHMMVMSRAIEVNRILKEILNNPAPGHA